MKKTSRCFLNYWNIFKYLCCIFFNFNFVKHLFKRQRIERKYYSQRFLSTMVKTWNNRTSILTLIFKPDHFFFVQKKCEPHHTFYTGLMRFALFRDWKTVNLFVFVSVRLKWMGKKGQHIGSVYASCLKKKL